jgi:pimeloyl-ACP methyl ester carboxylesterase
MRNVMRTWGLGLIVLLALGYLSICGYLFAEQRHLVFQPSGTVLGDPPADSAYRSLEVTDPGLGAIKAWWIPPASSAQPTIVFFHGNGSDRTDFLEQGLRFHEHGWGVVLASYRGYSGNPGSPTEDGLMADARATLAAIAPRVGPIIVWGHSLGSGVAARMASEGRAAGLVLEAPYTVLTDIGAARYPYIPVRWLMLYRFDTQSLTGEIHVPVLIFHSVDDPVIPFAMGQALAERLGARASLIKMEGVGHVPHTLDLSTPVLRWAQTQHIGGDVGT